MGSQPAQQIPGVYHRRIGDIIVTAISDSYLDGSIDVMRNIDLEKAERILKDAFRPVRRTNVNAFLIHSKGRLAIVDTGSGNYLLPTAGFVQRSLASAGIDPTAIDTVLLTHMHPDHSAGLTDMSNGQLLFPNAELVMHEDEPAHWFDDGAMSRADERARKLYFQAGREQVAPYKNRTRLFRQGEIFPGVTAVPSVGHTPGHSAYLVASGKDQLMIWGDTVHVPEVQTACTCRKCKLRFRKPAWRSTPISPRPRRRANACSIASLPTASWSPGCTCTSRHSRTWHGKATLMRYIPRPGCTRWMRIRALSKAAARLLFGNRIERRAIEFPVVAIGYPDGAMLRL
jgi:glyoxylase-like metal-dependent hydrolase (beta-lactamase superfamily II)